MKSDASYSLRIYPLRMSLSETQFNPGHRSGSNRVLVFPQHDGLESTTRRTPDGYVTPSHGCSRHQPAVLLQYIPRRGAGRWCPLCWRRRPRPPGPGSDATSASGCRQRCAASPESRWSPLRSRGRLTAVLRGPGGVRGRRHTRLTAVLRGPGGGGVRGRRHTRADLWREHHGGRFSRRFSVTSLTVVLRGPGGVRGRRHTRADLWREDHGGRVSRRFSVTSLTAVRDTSHTTAAAKSSDIHS